MKLLISEKQLELLLSKYAKDELDEQDVASDHAADAQPESGSTEKSGGQGYPQVTKWESGVKRGAGNQIGNTKWSDVVGSTLTRGKGNPLT